MLKKIKKSSMFGNLEAFQTARDFRKEVVAYAKLHDIELNNKTLDETCRILGVLGYVKFED